MLQDLRLLTALEKAIRNRGGTMRVVKDRQLQGRWQTSHSSQPSQSMAWTQRDKECLNHCIDRPRGKLELTATNCQVMAISANHRHSLKLASHIEDGVTH